MDASQEKFSFSRSFVHGELSMGFWSFAKKGAGALDSFFILASLSLYQFGVYQLLLSFYGVLSDFFHDVFGEVAGNDLGRLIGEGREDRAKRLFLEYAAFRLCMAALPWAVLFFASPLFSARYGSEMVRSVRILSFVFFGDAFLLLALTLLKVRLEFRALAPRASIQGVLEFAVVGSFFFFSHVGIREILLARLAGVVGVTLMLIPALIRSMRPWREVAAARGWFFYRMVRAYGKWALPQSLLGDFTGKARPWLIKLFLSTDAVGIFAVANTFISALKDLLPIRTTGALVVRKARDPVALDRFYRYGTKYYVWFATLSAIAAAAGVPLLVRLLFPKFVAALPLFYAMLVMVPLFAFIKPMNTFLVLFRRRKFIFLQALFYNAFWLATALIFLIFFPTIGVMNLAIVEVAASIADAATRYGYLLRTRLVSWFSPAALVTFDDEDRANFALFFKHFRSALPFMG